MKNVNLKKILTTACFISILSTSVSLAGPDFVDVPDGGYTRGAGRLLQHRDFKDPVLVRLRNKGVQNPVQYLANNMKAANVANQEYYNLDDLPICVGSFCY